MSYVGDNWSVFIYTDSLTEKYGLGTEVGHQRPCLVWGGDVGTDRRDTFATATVRGDAGGRSPGRSVWVLPRGLVPEPSLEG